jgi:apolipoprotein N-acyltransferase
MVGGFLNQLAQRRPFLSALILGGLSATGFAPLPLWPVMILCLAGLMILVRQLPSRGAAIWAGWCFGWGQFSVGLFWMAHSFTYQNTMPEWLGWFAPTTLALYLAVYPALATGLAWRMGRSSPTLFCLIFASAWTVTEWLRGTMFTGFPWNPLSVAFVDVAHIARMVGTYGASAVVILGAGTLIALATRRWAAATMLAVLPVLSILASFATVPGPDERTNTTQLHIVQPNIGQQDKYRPGYEETNFTKLAALTGRSNQPRLILWPEAAVPYFLDSEVWARQKIAALLGPRDIVLTGGDMLVFNAQRKLTGARNSMFALSATGDVLARYDKAHLVPYGEYLPMRALLEPLGLSRLVPGDIDFLPGPAPRTIALPGFASVGLQICYEIIFSGEVVDRANRPAFVFNPSNDAWFGRWQPPQHLAQARMRAIEEGLPVVRSTPTGISAIIDADGRVIKQLPYQQAGSISATVPPPHDPTVFARFGNTLSLLFAALIALIGIALRRRLS